MKKLLLILLSMVMILTGCASSSDVKSVKIQIKNSSIDQLNITGVNSFMKSGGVYDEEERQNWQEYLHDKYGVNIKTSPFIGDVADDIMQGKVDGIACVYNNSSFIKLIKSKNILPLDEYLKDNKAWNALPEEFRKSFLYDGQTWGIALTSVTRNFKHQGLVQISDMTPRWVVSSTAYLSRRRGHC